MDKIQGTRSHLSLDFTKPASRNRNVLPAPSLVTPILALSTPDEMRILSASTEFPILTPTGISHLMSSNSNTTTPSTYTAPITIATSPTNNSMINNNNYNSSHSYRPGNSNNTNNNNNNNNNNNENNHNFHMCAMNMGQNLTNLDNVSNIHNANHLIPSPLIPATVDNANNIDSSKQDEEGTKMVYQDQNTNHGYQNHQHNQNDHVKQRKSTNDNRGKMSNHADVEKIEKKRERNRLAAKKCRQRKIETIEDLRKTVSEKDEEYLKLQSDFDKFRKESTKMIEQLTFENTRLKKTNLIQ